jgi:hypothetical protein
MKRQIVTPESILLKAVHKIVRLTPQADLCCTREEIGPSFGYHEAWCPYEIAGKALEEYNKCKKRKF